MSALADAVLPLIRTRSDVWRWNVANAHGAQMPEAVAILQQAAEDDDPADVFAVTQRAIAPALGADGMAAYRAKLAEHQATLGPRPADRFSSTDPCGGPSFASPSSSLAEPPDPCGGPSFASPSSSLAEPPDSHAWFTLDWNAQRLAVFDRDVEAIIATHARDRRVAAWLQDASVALMEIGEVDAAIDYARQATDFDNGHQARRAADYWCELLAEHRPDELLAARVEVFRRWPSSGSAGTLYRDAGAAWLDYRDEVLERLAAQPRDAVAFAQHSLNDVRFAWELADSLGLDDARTWSDLAKAYEKLDPAAVLPVYTRLVQGDLVAADARNYRSAARRLKKMRKLAARSGQAAQVDGFIADLREQHQRRPRLQQEFDRAGLP